MTGAEWAAIGVTLFGVVVAIYLSNRDIKNEFRADLGTVQTGLKADIGAVQTGLKTDLVVGWD